MATPKRISEPMLPQTLRQRAEDRVRASPTDIAGMTSSEVQRLIHALQIHQIELELQNEELRQAQVELAHSRDQYSDLYEFASTGYVTLDSLGKILSANLTTATMLGVQRQQLLQASLGNFLNRQSQDAFYLHLQAVLSSETKQSCEVRMKGADARGLIVRLESIAFGIESDRRCRTALIDLTAERQAQQQLQQSESRYHNSAKCEITGYTAEDLIGQSPRVLQGDNSNRETLDRIREELSAGRSVLAEVINYRKDGTRYDAELFITPMVNAEGHCTNFVSIHRDITERKRAENLLRQERDLAQRYLDIVSVIMVALDCQGDITLINRKGCEVLGYNEHELLGKNWIDTCLPQGSRNEVRSIFQQIINGTVANVEYFENPVLTRMDEERIVEWHNSEIRDGTGRVVGVLSSGNDITGRRQAEQDLRASDERSQAILASLPAQIAVINCRGTITAVNPAWEAFALANGGSPERCNIGVNYLDVCRAATGEEGVKVAEQLRAILDGAATLFTMEYPCHSGTQQRWFLLQAVPLRHDKGGAVVTHTNITDRIEAEKALRAAHQRLEAVVETVPSLIVVTDQGGRVVHFNRACEELSGYRRDEVLGCSILERFVPEGWRSEVARRFADPHAPELREPHENPWLTRAGDERLIEWRCLTLPQPDETSPWFLVGFGIDITERKRAEERLALQARQQADIAALGQKALIGEPLQELMDEAVRAVADTLGNEFVQVLELLPGGDRLLLRAGVGWKEGLIGKATVSVGRASQAGYTLLSSEPVVVTDLAAETRFEGSPLLTEHGVVSGISCAILGTGGEPYGVLGTHTRSRREFTPDDVAFLAGIANVLGTVIQRRLLEESRRASEERMRAILNTAADAIITIDQRGFITMANPTTERMFGYSQEELVGQNVNILMPAPYRDEHDQYIKRYLDTGIAHIIGIGREVVGRRKDGSSFPIGLAVSKIDHLRLFTGIIRDMSEQRKLQREVVAIAEDEQRRIGQDLHDGTQQELAGLGMMTQTLYDMLAQESRERQKASVDKCCDLAKRILNGLAQAQQEVQSVSRGLVPIRLDPEGLMDALRELASRTDQLCGITCAFKCEQPVKVSDSSTATHLYRIAQEALTNALKHARPEHILIALESDNGHPTLQVADDGTGFNSSEKSEGLGLKTMHYRASLIGASLSICPVATRGTLVTCKVFGGGAICHD